jgi:hypothetical protein
MKNRNKTTKFPVVRFPLILIDPTCHTERLLDLYSLLKARIKKIMQKDEEVGKVAQATPIVICTSLRSFSQQFIKLCPAKALELFLQLVVDEAARVTTTRGSKKVEAYHLCVPLLFPNPVSSSSCLCTRFACTLFPSSLQKARNRDD